jgi:hypothetical protein
MVYDVCRVPGSDDVVGVNWNVDPRMWRLEHGARPGEGTFTDLGPATPGLEPSAPRGVNTNHAGGLVFSAEGELLYTVCGGDDAGDILPRAPAVLRAMDVQTGASRDLCELVDEESGTPVRYVSRAARIGAEHLVLGTVSREGAGFAHVVLDDDLTDGPWQDTPRRHWG